MKLKQFLLVLILSVHSVNAFADALLQPRPGEVLLGPVPLQETVAGTPLHLQVSMFLLLTEGQDDWTLGVRVVLDLADLQVKIGPLFDTVPLPGNSCDHRGHDNYVVRVWGKHLPIADSTATVVLHGDVDVWSCVANVPCSRVDWDGFIPRVTLYDCNPPLNNRILRQPFTARLPFTLGTDGQTLAVNLGQPNIDLGGPLGGVTGTILDIVGVGINGHAVRLLDQAVNADTLRLSLPEEVRRFGLKIADARLMENEGRLTATVHLQATVSKERLDEISPLFQQTF